MKASVHGAVLGLSALCAAYNFAAWLTRHQMHLAVNTLLYAAVVAWETAHVKHHLDVPPRRLALVTNDVANDVATDVATDVPNDRVA